MCAIRILKITVGTYFKPKRLDLVPLCKMGPDGDRVNCFEFDVRLCNLWWHRMIHWSTYGSQCQAVRTVLESTLQPQIRLKVSYSVGVGVEYRQQ